MFRSFHSQLPFAFFLIPTENSGNGEKNLKANDGNYVQVGWLFSLTVLLVVLKNACGLTPVSQSAEELGLGSPMSWIENLAFNPHPLCHLSN